MLKTTPEASVKREESRKLAQESVSALQSNGFIKKIDVGLNKVYVDMRMWDSMNHDQKEITSKMIALYCGYEKGTDLFWVEINDWQSGRKLAKYSKSWGFEIY